MQGLYEGRIVHYVLDQGPNHGAHRPAIVTAVARDAQGQTPADGYCQLQVFTDGQNDGGLKGLFGAVLYDASGEPGTWHFIEEEA